MKKAVFAILTALAVSLAVVTAPPASAATFKYSMTLPNNVMGPTDPECPGISVQAGTFWGSGYLKFASPWGSSCYNVRIRVTVDNPVFGRITTPECTIGGAGIVNGCHSAPNNGAQTDAPGAFVSAKITVSHTGGTIIFTVGVT